MLKFKLSRILDYLVLSLAATGVLCLGYTFTAASMLILYATVYAFVIDGNGMF